MDVAQRMKARKDSEEDYCRKRHACLCLNIMHKLPSDRQKTRFETKILKEKLEMNMSKTSSTSLNLPGRQNFLI
ncbi:hypothetical protein HZS_2189 [Henneguya salminicola]|nr:hypothetical protein HZS_2189 [Henneguya salminicola]